MRFEHCGLFAVSSCEQAVSFSRQRKLEVRRFQINLLAIIYPPSECPSQVSIHIVRNQLLE